MIQYCILLLQCRIQFQKGWRRGWVNGSNFIYLQVEGSHYLKSTLPILSTYFLPLLTIPTDGGIITWLKKGCSLWKPKAKAKPKNKCPWSLIKFLYFIWLFLSQGYFSNFTIVGYGPQLQAIGFINESYLIMGLDVWALVFNLLGLNNSPCTIRNPNTTRTSLYIYRVLNVLKEQNELINKIECFEQQACWPLLFLSLSLFQIGRAHV